MSKLNELINKAKQLDTKLDKISKRKKREKRKLLKLKRHLSKIEDKIILITNNVLDDEYDRWYNH